MLTAAVKAGTGALHDACRRDREAVVSKNVAAHGTIAAAHSM